MKTYMGDVYKAIDDAKQIVLGAGAQGSFGRSRQVGPGGYGSFGHSALFSPSYGPVSYGGGFGGFGGFPMPMPMPYPVRVPTFPTIQRVPIYVYPTNLPSFEPPPGWIDYWDPLVYGPPPGPSLAGDVATLEESLGLSDYDALSDYDDGLGLWDGGLSTGTTGGGSWFSGIGDSLGSLGSGLFGGIGSGLTSLGSGVGNLIGGLGSGLGNVVTPLASSLGGLVTQIGPQLGPALGQLLTNKLGVEQMKNDAKLKKAELKAQIEQAKVLAKNPWLAASTPTSTTTTTTTTTAAKSMFEGNNALWIAAAAIGGMLLAKVMSK